MKFKPGLPWAIPVLAALLFAIILLQIRNAPETYPWGDTATTSLYAMRAARGELATGAYSRFHWNHPGPLLYQLLAPLYRMSGYREISLKWTMWMLNLGALAALLRVLWRRAPTLASTVAAAFVPLLWREQRLLFWAWNPIAPLTALALSIALAAGIAAGEISLLPWFAAVASFVVQAHVGLAPIEAVLVCGASVMLWRRIAAGHRPSGSGTLIAAAILTLAVLWAVPLVSEARTRPGNLVQLASFFLDRSNPPHSWSSAGAVLVNQLIGPLNPRWSMTTAAAVDSTPAGPAVAAGLILVLLIASAISAARRRALYESSFDVLCLVSSLVGLLAIRSIVGPISDYLVVWIAVVGALSLAAIAAEAIQLLRPRAFDGPIWARALVGYILVVASLGAAWLMSKHAADSRSVVVRSFAQTLVQRTQMDAIQKPLLGFSQAAWDIGTGTVLQFYKEGRPIAVSDSMLYLVGEPFKATGKETGEYYLMRQDEDALPPGVTRHEWLMTQGEVRLVRVFRDQ